MSRAQRIRGFFATQTNIPRIAGELLPILETHGRYREEVCRYGKTTRTTFTAFKHQRFKRHDPQDL